jgi:hypothetical protein
LAFNKLFLLVPLNIQDGKVSPDFSYIPEWKLQRVERFAIRCRKKLDIVGKPTKAKNQNYELDRPFELKVLFWFFSK